MIHHFKSKTNFPFLLLLGAVLLMACTGKLSAEAVDAIKWLGGTFFGVRAAANVAEQLGKKSE